MIIRVKIEYSGEFKVNGTEFYYLRDEEDEKGYYKICAVSDNCGKTYYIKRFKVNRKKGYFTFNGIKIRYKILITEHYKDYEKEIFLEY